MVKNEKALAIEMVALGLWVVRTQQSQSRIHRHCTHLTIDQDRGIQEDQIKYYGQKGGNSCKGVNLSNTKRKISPGTGAADETKVRRISLRTHIARR